MDELFLTDEVNNEEAEPYTDESLYNITSYGTDMMLGQIADMFNTGEIEKPDMQRNYVWTKSMASRFIDSILLGLPVPSIFLAKDKNNRLLIVDGLQRIVTISDYIKGRFSKDGSAFRLSNTDSITDKWRGRSFEELPDNLKRAIRIYPLHAIVFEQKKPSDDSGMYQIFERINTGGQILKPQEIRNSVYHGPFNDFIKELNEERVWREVLGTDKPDSRMADDELILRFFAFLDFRNRKEAKQKQINLAQYLNNYMHDHVNIDKAERQQFKKTFLEIITYLKSHVGEHLFRTIRQKGTETDGWTKTVNPVIFDAVCTATYYAEKEGRLMGQSLEKRYTELVTSKDFDEVTCQQTTNVDRIKQRSAIAAKILYDIEI